MAAAAGEVTALPSLLGEEAASLCVSGETLLSASSPDAGEARLPACAGGDLDALLDDAHLPGGGSHSTDIGKESEGRHGGGELAAALL